MNRTVLICTLVVLALAVAAFLVTWFQIPAAGPASGRVSKDDLDPPASWVATGLDLGPRLGQRTIVASDLKERALIGLGAVAGIVIILGLAVAAIARPRRIGAAGD